MLVSRRGSIFADYFDLRPREIDVQFAIGIFLSYVSNTNHLMRIEKMEIIATVIVLAHRIN